MSEIEKNSLKHVQINRNLLIGPFSRQHRSHPRPSVHLRSVRQITAYLYVGTFKSVDHLARLPTLRRRSLQLSTKNVPTIRTRTRLLDMRSRLRNFVFRLGRSFFTSGIYRVIFLSPLCCPGFSVQMRRYFLRWNRLNGRTSLRCVSVCV